MRAFFAVVVSFMVFGLAGCGAVDQITGNSDNNGKNVKYTKMSLGTPLEYGIHDSKCQESTESFAIHQQSIFLLDGEDVEESSGDLTLESNENGLTSKFLQATGYGYRDETLMDLHLKDEHIHTAMSFDQFNPKPLRVCNPQGDVAESSPEAVALTSINSIHRAAEFYQTLSQAQSLSKVHLNVLPLSYQRIRLIDETADVEDGLFDGPVEFSAYQTDNAYWMPFDVDGETNYEIAVLPQSEEAKSLGYFNGAGLWQIAFVLMHEFGHHIYFHHYDRLLEDLLTEYSADEIRERFSKYWGPKTKLGDLMRVVRQDQSRQGAISESLFGAIAAVSEGFADLFAYYASGEDHENEANIKCFAKTRDVGSSVFVDGISKTLTADSLDDLESGLASIAEQVAGLNLEDEEDTDCDDYEFSDPHIIGAVFAYGVDQLYKAATSDVEERAVRSLKWIDALNDDYKDSLAGIDSTDYLRIAAQRAAEQALSEASSELNDKQCKILEDVFPAFYKTWSKPSTSFTAFKSCVGR